MNIRPTLAELKEEERRHRWNLAFTGKRVGWMCPGNENRPHVFETDVMTSQLFCIYCQLDMMNRTQPR